MRGRFANRPDDFAATVFGAGMIASMRGRFANRPDTIADNSIVPAKAASMRGRFANRPDDTGWLRLLYPAGRFNEGAVCKPPGQRAGDCHGRGGYVLQ